MPHQITLKTIRSRPRFKIKTVLSKAIFNQKLKRRLKLHTKTLGGYVGKETSVIRLRQDKEKYWAPQLRIRVEKDDENPNLTVVRGLFGPRPTIWTLFIFFYSLGSTLVVFFGLVWFVQWNLNIPTSFGYFTLLGVLILLITYLSSFVGKRIARPHMKVLRVFMETVLIEEKILDEEMDKKKH